MFCAFLMIFGVHLSVAVFSGKFYPRMPIQNQENKFSSLPNMRTRIPTELVQSKRRRQLPMIGTFLMKNHQRKHVGLISYLIETLERNYFLKRTLEPFPTITRLDLLELDLGIVLQELLLKILEWFAFIITDLIFRLVWPL